MSAPSSPGGVASGNARVPSPDLKRAVATLRDWTRRPIVRWVGAIATIAAVCTVTYALVYSAVPPLEPQSVADDWSHTISQFGIEALFPPEEDVQVGDVFAVIKRPGVFASRAIKLSHVDLTDLLRNSYMQAPVFPDTAPRPLHDYDFWPQLPAQADVFSIGGTHRTLSVVAFPGFTIQHDREASAALTPGGSLLARVAARFGAGRSNAELETTQIPNAETYGIAALDATGALAEYCGFLGQKSPTASSGATRSNPNPECTEAGARRMLSNVVGCEVWAPPPTGPGAAPASAPSYANEVEIIMIYRLYLTRSIMHLRSTDSAEAITARVARQLREAIATSAEPARGAAAPGEAPGETAAALEQQRQRLLATLDGLSGAAPGGGVQVTALDSDHMVLNQTFQRPVAIGFRAVRLQPSPSSGEPREAKACRKDMTNAGTILRSTAVPSGATARAGARADAPAE